jgi:paraquat-inducible protein B
MRKKISPLAVGGFVFGAAALAIAAVMILWGSRLFTRSQAYILYFNGDVNGLHTGAAVKFKGVQVGYVDQILLSFDTSAASPQPALTIPVIVELNSKTVLHQGTSSLDLDDPGVINDLVRLGLRGQLATESLVTGILYVSLDMRPGTRAKFVAPHNSKYPEIPTVPTPIEQAQELAMRALSMLGKVDLDRLLSQLAETIQRVGSLAQSPELEEAIDSMPTTIKKLGAAADSIQHLADSTGHQLEATTEAVRKTTASADLTLAQTQTTLRAVRDAIGAGSPIDYQLGQTLNDLSQAARAVRELADYLNRNPSAILRGRGVLSGQ